MPSDVDNCPMRHTLKRARISAPATSVTPQGERSWVDWRMRRGGRRVGAGRMRILRMQSSCARTGSGLGMETFETGWAILARVSEEREGDGW